MELTELRARAEGLVSGYTSPADAIELIDAAIEICSASQAPLEWECRQISHAITMAGWGLWRAVGAALNEAFKEQRSRDDALYDVVTVDDLRRMRAELG